MRLVRRQVLGAVDRLARVRDHSVPLAVLLAQTRGRAARLVPRHARAINDRVHLVGRRPVGVIVVGQRVARVGRARVQHIGPRPVVEAVAAGRARSVGIALASNRRLASIRHRPDSESARLIPGGALKLYRPSLEDVLGHLQKRTNAGAGHDAPVASDIARARRRAGPSRITRTGHVIRAGRRGCPRRLAVDARRAHNLCMRIWY